MGIWFEQPATWHPLTTNRHLHYDKIENATKLWPPIRLGILPQNLNASLPSTPCTRLMAKAASHRQSKPNIHPDNDMGFPA